MPFLSILALALASPPIQTQPAYIRDLSKPAPMLPQTQPFIQYTRPAYDFNLSSDEAAVLGVEGKRPKHWWSGEIEGVPVGGPTLSAESPFGSGANLVRAAYGLRSWGLAVDDKGWIDKADRMARLFLVHSAEKTPISFNFRSKTAEYGSMAEGGYATAAWLNRWLTDYPDVDFAAQAKAYIARAESEALRDSQPGDDALWLLAERLESGQIAGSGADQARQKLTSMMANVSPHAARPQFLRAAAAAIRVMPENLGSTSLLLEAMPKTPSGYSGGLILDGYIYGSGNPDLWQDGALAYLQIAASARSHPHFERAAQMIRATLNDFNCANLVGNNMPGPREQIDGRAVNGDFGRSYLPKHKGFAAEEGHTLTTLAISQKRFGSVFASSSGWMSGIDGIVVFDGKPYSGLSLNPGSYDSYFPAYLVRQGQTKPEAIGQPALLGAIREIVVEYRDNHALLIAKANPVQFSGNGSPKGTFILADGTKLPANPGPSGFETPITAADLNGPVSFEGSLGGMNLRAKGAHLTLEPNLAAAWIPMGSMQAPASPDAITTQKDPTIWGEMRSEVFTSPHKTLTFTWQAVGDARVELWDVDEVLVLRRTPPIDRTQDATTTWDISEFSNRRLQVRVVDNDLKGWISVRSFKLR